MELNGSGIVPEHVDAVGQVARDDDVFIFIRPTSNDARTLIALGYPTKSSDVHNKSSDWGPMAGFVPVDPAFDKNLGKNPASPELKEPDPNIDPAAHESRATDPTHNVKVTQLFLTEALLAKLSADGKIRWEKEGGAFTGPHNSSDPKRKVIRKKAVVTTGSGVSGALPEARWYKATADHARAREMNFFLTKQEGGRWLVWYESGKPKIRDERQVAALYVFAYEIEGEKKPVTGDYDLWLVAPKISKHGWQHLVMATTGNAERHGESAATEYIRGLLTRLNAACGRTRSPVFWHGAEAQNYGFTQGLDKELALFTPSGNKKMIAISQVPRALYEIRMRAYLVYWNKRYGEPDPHLMGEAANQDAVSRINRMQGQLRDFTYSMAAYRQNRDERKQLQGQKSWSPEDQARLEKLEGRSPNLSRQAIRSAFQLAAKAGSLEIPDAQSPPTQVTGFVAKAGEVNLADDKLYMIRKFYEELHALTEWMKHNSADWKLLALGPADFKDNVGMTPVELRHFQLFLEKTVTETSTGKGETDWQKLQPELNKMLERIKVLIRMNTGR